MRQFFVLASSSPAFVRDTGVQELGLDVLLLPSTGFEPWMNAMLRACREAEVKTVWVPDNWDNLTSKNSVGVSPDAIVTLGEASGSNLSRLLQVGIETVWPIGIPKFSTIESRPREDRKNTAKILFLGFSLPYDEINTLNGLYRALRHDFRGTVEVHYKPHPNRKPRCNEEPTPDPGITLIETNSTFVLPELDKAYSEFLHEYDVVIAPPTTMLLEFLVAGSSHLIQDDTLDSIHQTSPKIFADTWLHLLDLEPLRLPAGNGSLELYEIVGKCLKGECRHPHQSEIDQVVCPNPETYHELLSKKIDDLIDVSGADCPSTTQN